ncbi:MAG: hypothetical protein ABSH32_07200 [Bryobacteraceae bacterium]|jgi:hypothetical protein
MRSRAIALLLLASSAAFAGDAAFDRIVHEIESHYGTQRTHIPFLGMADFVVKVAHPEGVTSFKMAFFEDLKSPLEAGAWRELDRFMESLPGELHPIVRVHSRRNGDSVYIFAEPVGKSTRMLLAVFEREEATMIQVKVDAQTLLQSIEDPEHARQTFSSRDR